jgi:pimeloyl-ACP methyl ester carboxylesterase
MTQLHSHDLVRPDATIHYWTGGAAADTPTVVFLHGATLDHRAWQPQTDALRPRFRVIAPDLRGHGSSTGRFDFTAAVEDIIALLGHLPGPPVVLVGLSLGANIAQEVIRRRPDLVGGLVAADTTCNTADRHPLAAASTVAALRVQAMWAGNGFARQAARASATDPHVQNYILEVNAHRSNQETIDILTCLLTAALQPDPSYRLPVPALLVHGQLDHIGDITTDMRAWAHREPLARYAVIPGAGHISNLDNPAVFTNLLVEFIDQLPPPAETEPPTDLPDEHQAEDLYRR